jgi:hypothetical protein
MNKIKSNCLAILAAAALLACNRAEAAVESFITSTPIASTLTDWSGTMAFQQFNPSLGTLLSVTLNVSADLETTLTVVNNSPSSSHGKVWTDLQVTVEDGGNNLITPSVELDTPQQTYTLAGGHSLILPEIDATGSSSQAYTLAAILAEFTGTGSIALDASTLTQTGELNTGGNTAASQVTTAGATGTVIYNYLPAFTPVPEPSTYLAGFTAAGMAGATWLRRRKS